MRINQCCLCNSPNLSSAVQIGSSGLANNLELSRTHALQADVYELELLICEDCHHVQLSEAIDPGVLFSSYNYETGVSSFFHSHFKEYAKYAASLCDGLAIDIGSNDCTLLRYLQAEGFKVLGVEPATNLADRYSSEFNIYNAFFDHQLASQILESNGAVDLVTANNVFAHSRDLQSFASSAFSILRPGGYFIIEVQYLIDMMENTCFDMIYHEHTSYHHIAPLRKFFLRLGFSLADVQSVPTHGGSIRLVLKKDLEPNTSFENKITKLDSEFDSSLAHRLNKFQEEISSYKKSIASILSEQIATHDLLYGYAAPAKAVTLLSTLPNEIVDSLEFIIDDNPLKQGKFLSGTGIPVISSKEAELRIKDKKAACIIFAWNVATDIATKLFKSDIRPDCAIVPLPIPKIISGL